MKKTRRLLCMSLAVVMLLGAIPAYAATPMTAAASLIALPLSGKLFTALPVSDNISKALTVKEIESTYSTSTEAKSAPTSAPVEQTTFATTANPAPADRLPDGTTGATVGLVGKTTDITSDELKAVYPGYTTFCHVQLKEWTVQNIWKPIAPNRPCYSSGIVAFTYDASRKSPKDLVGQLIPSGWLVDVYAKHGGKYDFICQYDTRDGNPLTITAAPGSSAAKPMLMAAATAAPASFSDVKPGDWYYEAVTALANGNVLHGVFDADPNGNFNPNALVTGGEFEFIRHRLSGRDTEDLIMKNSDFLDNSGYRAEGTRYHVATQILNMRSRLQSSATTGQAALTDSDAMAIDAFADMCAKDNNRNFGLSYGNAFAIIRDKIRAVYALGAIRTPVTPAAIDFDARVTRAELCVMLYRAGLTSFGCCPYK